MRIKLTKAVIEAIEPPEDSAQLIVRDSELPGFALRVTAAGAKSYIVERKVAGKTVRTTIGRVGVVQLPDARAKGLQLLAAMASGENPNAKAAPVDVWNPTTLQQAFDGYLKERTSVKPGLKPRTVRDYRELWKYLHDWHDLPLASISRAMVADRHAELTAKPSPTTANRVMRTLSAVMNYAADNDGFSGPDGRPQIVTSPVTVLKARRLWNKDKRRTSHLDAHTLPSWWRLVDDVTDDKWPDRCEVIRDYWRFLLLTGMRSEEAARLQASNVDLARGVIVQDDMKNRDDFAVPVGPWVRAMLTRRLAVGGTWVFPSPKRPCEYTSAGHDIRYILNARHDIEWTPHDLRRTYATVLDSFDVSRYVVKRLLGHKSGADVTAGYVQIDIDRLRPVVNRLELRLLELCGVKESDQAG